MQVIRVLMLLLATICTGALPQTQPGPGATIAFDVPITQSDHDPSRRAYFEAWAGQFHMAVRRNREDFQSQAPTRNPTARIRLDRSGKVQSVVIERSSGNELYDEILGVLIRRSEALSNPPAEIFQPNRSWIELVAAFEWRLEPEEILVRVAINDEAWGAFRQSLASEIAVTLKAIAKTAIIGRTATVEYRVSSGRIESWRLTSSAGDPQVDSEISDAFAIVANRITAPGRPRSVRARIELSINIE